MHYVCIFQLIFSAGGNDQFTQESQRKDLLREGCVQSGGFGAEYVSVSHSVVFDAISR